MCVKRQDALKFALDSYTKATKAVDFISKICLLHVEVNI